MATNVAKRSKSAARPQKGTRTEDPQATEKIPSLRLEEPTATVDEDNPSHAGEESKENSVDFRRTELSPAILQQDQGSRSAPEPAMSLAQKYTLLSIQTFADCVVQQSPDGIFDVLARNFADNGNLSYFLHKIGFGHLTAFSKGHDIVDYIRKTSHELFKAMKDVGKAIARW